MLKENYIQNPFKPIFNSKDFIRLHPSIHSRFYVYSHNFKPILVFLLYAFVLLDSLPLLIQATYTLICYVKKLDLKFYKRILGVHRKNVPFAVLSEPRRFRAHILKTILNY